MLYEIGMSNIVQTRVWSYNEFELNTKYLAPVFLTHWMELIYDNFFGRSFSNFALTLNCKSSFPGES